MKKAMYILGSVEMTCGLLLLSAISMLKEIFPLWGRGAFQAAAAGSYSPESYAGKFTLAGGIGLALLIIGAVQAVCAVIKKD